MLRAPWLGRPLPRTILVPTLVLGLLFAAPALAAPPLATLMPFKKKVEADPKQAYELDESHGPWMILAASFAGPSAEQQSHDLVIELRQKYNIEAYTFRQTYDFTKPTEGLGFDRYGGKRRMRYASNYKFDEIAVLVGNHTAVDSPQIEKMADMIRHIHPDALNPEKRPDSSQRFLGLRTLYQMVSTDMTKKTKGPMGAAFITRNPLLPDELFVAKGLDPFVVEMNKDLPYNLLKNPGRYTVRVASFRGVDTMKPAEFERLTTKPRKLAKIDQAAINASNLCEALRQKGIEAYEFHDRTESLVTIGSFNEVGQPRADGKIEINPAVHRLMEEYGPIEKLNPRTRQIELLARTLKVGDQNLRFDPQPMPVEVPKQSIAAAYNATTSLLR
jgi:hypothetical protein